MTNANRKDAKRRKLFLKRLQKRRELKTIIKNPRTTTHEKYEAQFQLQKLPRNSMKVRLKDRCVLTGRSQSVVGPFNISRVKLRELISNGLVPGVRKSVW